MRKSIRMLALVLCFLIALSAIPVNAITSTYSTVSSTGESLQYPRKTDYLTTPFQAQVKATRRGGNIYYMPKPQAGNGHLGMIVDGEIVTILAQKNGFYFFMSKEGYLGWNGTRYFSRVEKSVGSTVYELAPPAGYTAYSDKGVKLALPYASEYLNEVMYATVKASRRGGSIYLMPMPQRGNGNLGYVLDGETVTILAQKNGFYFVMTEDGRYGWNGESFFTLDSGSGRPSSSDGYLTDSQYEEIAKFLVSDDCGYCSPEFYAYTPIVLLSASEPRATVTIHGAYNTTYHLFANTGYSATAEWKGSFDRNDDAQITITRQRAGTTYFEVSNDYNYDSFLIMVIVID